MNPAQTTPNQLSTVDVEVREFIPQSATEAEWQAFQSVGNREDLENWPDDPPTTLNDIKNNLLNIPSFVEFKGRLVYRAEMAIAYMFTGIMLTEENQHLLQFDMYLIPEERCKGIGSHMLEWVIAEAKSHDRRLLLTDTSSVIPSGDAFMEKLGGEMGLSVDVNQLVIEDIDHVLLDRWLAQASKRSGDLTLGIWEGLYPDGEIEAIAEMKRTMNTAPRDDLDIEDMNITADQIREVERSFAARDSKRWTYYVRDPENNALAGYTELYWKPSKPEHLGQGDTAVVPAYRNRGIGRWLKAAALKDVLAKHPNIKFVRTGNATSNEAMLKINHEMGFRLYQTSKNWQVDRGKVEEYLAGK